MKARTWIPRWAFIHSWFTWEKSQALANRCLAVLGSKFAVGVNVPHSVVYFTLVVCRSWSEDVKTWPARFTGLKYWSPLTVALAIHQGALGQARLWVEQVGVTVSRGQSTIHSESTWIEWACVHCAQDRTEWQGKTYNLLKDSRGWKKDHVIPSKLHCKEVEWES